MVNEYLTSLSESLKPDEIELASIEKSNNYLNKIINEELKGQVNSIKLFGSFERETFISVKYSPRSDIDLMIIYKESTALKPQTLLNKLKEIILKYYPNSIVYQDHPTISLELQNIKFELVPTKTEWFLFSGDTLIIPVKNGDNHTWKKTYPSYALKYLAQRDKAEKSLLRPLIRLLKYYNAKIEYKIPPFILETKALELSYFFCETLQDYLFYFIEENEVLEPEENSKLKEMKKNIKMLQGQNLQDYSLMEIQKHFKPISA